MCWILPVREPPSGPIDQLDRKGYEVTKLYRSAHHLTQWVAYSSMTGWVLFPAREGGWYDRVPARGIDPRHLQQVPLRLAFRTGLLESEVQQRRAA